MCHLTHDVRGGADVETGTTAKGATRKPLKVSVFTVFFKTDEDLVRALCSSEYICACRLSAMHAGGSIPGGR